MKVFLHATGSELHHSCSLRNFYFNPLQVYNPGQNIWNKLEESSKIGQEKSLISTSGCFLTALGEF